MVGVSQAAWEDADTVLAYVDEGGDQAIVRLGTNGSIEAATDVITVPSMSVGDVVRRAHPPLTSSSATL